MIMEDPRHLNEPAATGKPKIILPGDDLEQTTEPVPEKVEPEGAIVVERIASTTDVRSVAQTGTFILLIFYMPCWLPALTC